MQTPQSLALGLVLTLGVFLLVSGGVIDRAWKVVVA